MIELTKLNLEKFYMNCELIEIIEQMPDTLITMTTGKKYYALESAAEVIEKIKTYKKELMENSCALYIKKGSTSEKEAEEANRVKSREAKD